MAATCDCLPSPPDFYLEAPPDPSLLFPVLNSDDYLEPFFTCAAEQERHGEQAWSGLTLLALTSIGLLLVLLVSMIAMSILLRRRRRRNERDRLLLAKSKTNSYNKQDMADVTRWSYNSMQHAPPHAITLHNNTILMYGASPKSVARSLPRRLLSTTGQAPDGHIYCTLSRAEEFSRQSLNKKTRRPPPACRPPPPPAPMVNDSPPLSTDESIGNSIERELELIHSSPSPKREEFVERKSRLSLGEGGGRESGYGTAAPSRTAWNSPQARHHHSRSTGTSRGDHGQQRSLPLAVYAQQNAHAITYV